MSVIDCCLCMHPVGDLGAPYIKLGCGGQGAHVFHNHCLLKMYFLGPAPLVKYYEFLNGDNRYSSYFNVNSYRTKCPICKVVISTECILRIGAGLTHLPQFTRLVKALQQFANDYSEA